MTGARFALHRPANRRIALPIETVLVIAMPLMVLGAALELGRPDPAGGVGGALLVLIGGALACIWLIRNLPRAGRTATGAQPSLAIDGEALVLDDPIVLRAPLRLGFEGIAAIAFDGAPRRRRGLGSTLGRFPVAGTGAYAWGGRAGSRLPRLGHARDVPNMAIALREPLTTPPLRGFGRGWFFGQPPHGRQRPGDPLPGVLVTVADPDAARAALEPSGLVRELAPADLDGAPQRTRAHRRAARFERAALVAFGADLALELLSGFGVF